MRIATFNLENLDDEAGQEPSLNTRIAIMRPLGRLTSRPRRGAGNLNDADHRRNTLNPLPTERTLPGPTLVHLVPSVTIDLLRLSTPNSNDRPGRQTFDVRGRHGLAALEDLVPAIERRPLNRPPSVVRSPMGTA
jgi:hypothetical protein